MAVGSDKLTDTTGIRLSSDAFVVIVRTEWNAHVVDLLEEGCLQILKENSVKSVIIKVPGAFEIPFAIKNYADHSGKMPDAYISLGCVIRGDTPHFDYVCDGVAQGMMNLNITMSVPVIYGVLTVNNQVQADERTGGRHGHKGKEAAAAAIKMIALNQQFKGNAG